MDNQTLLAGITIIVAGLTTALGCMLPALGQGKAIASALSSIAQQPDAEQRIPVPSL